MKQKHVNRNLYLLIKASFLLLLNIGLVVKLYKKSSRTAEQQNSRTAEQQNSRTAEQQNSRTGEKKNLGIILFELFHLVWVDYALAQVLENPKVFIEEYFSQAIYLKSHSLDDYIIDSEARLIMWLSAAGSMKTILRLEDKGTCIKILSKMGVPCPEILGYIRKESNSVIWENEQGIKSDLTLLLEREKRVFAKPTDGYEGRGCILLEKSDHGKIIANGEHLALPALADRIDSDLQIEKVVINHPMLARFHEASLNTLRLITLKDPDKGIYLDRAVLRVGVNGNHTDNWCTGGLAIRIMPDGSLDHQGIYEDPTKKSSLSHPNSGLCFYGQMIPFFKEAVDMVLGVHRSFSRINGLGFDVAITPSGPLIIEINPFFYALFQAQCGAARKMYYKRYLAQALRYAELTDQIL